MNPIERLDVSLHLLERQTRADAETQRLNELCAVLRDSQARHAALGNEHEVIADGEALYMLQHPELCSTDADYPGWTPGGTR